MIFKKGIIIVCLLLAMIVGYDIRRADSGKFTVIRGSNYIAPLPDDGKVNINTADEDELAELTGIGSALAQRIIEYRQTTPFTSIEELLNISGIGVSKYDAIKDNIKIE